MMYSGVQFALVGFNPVHGNSLRSKLVSNGGVEVGQYSQSCTHLIVDKLVYDDPICVAARNSGKVVVTGSWVDHTFVIGMLVNANSLLFRPLRDLNGIPGSKTLVVCLTGYQGQDREDIMTMVGLIGGQFSKPLVANRVTHLICYKFEGEKYELAKRIKRIKLVNHRWLEDCLKNWKLLPEVDYEISGYELDLMEASARDSEDEAEDASVKRANNSPLGLRVGVVAAVDMSKPGGKDIPLVRTNSGAQEGSSLCNTSKDNWVTPKKTDRPFEAMVSTDPQQHNYQRESTFQDTSNYVSPVRVANKTPEQGISRMETDGSTSINRSIRRHSSLATYSRKTLQRSPETDTLGKESSGQNGTLRMDDKGLKASTAFNISASKSGSSVERTSLFDDLDEIDMLHGEEFPPMMPQPKFTDGSVSRKDSQKVHNSETSIPPPTSLLLQELRPSSPNENLRPVMSISDPTESEETGHKSPASELNTKLLSSNVVPVVDALSTAENIISNCARDEIPERSWTETMTGNVLLQEPRSGSPKQNLRVVPNLSDHTESREAAHKLDLSDSAARLFNSGVVPMEADIRTPENSTMKGALDEVPEISVTEPVMRRSSTSPGSGLIGMKDKQETELPKKKAAPKKSLGTRGRKKNPINQKGSIYLSEPTPKDERNDCLNKGKVSAPVTGNSNQKEISSPVLNTEVVPEMAKHIDSETEALQGIDSVDNKSLAPEEKDHLVLDLMVNQDKLQAKTPEQADAEVEITVLERELNDVPTEDPSEGALQLEVDKNTSKRKREAAVGKDSLQSGKKGSSSTGKVGKSSVKKTKKSRKEHDTKANSTLTKDIGDKSADGKETLAFEHKTVKVSSGGDQSPVAGETLARKEAAPKDPSDAAVQLEVDTNKVKRRKQATVEENWLQTPTVKKAKISKKEDGAKAKNTVMKDIWIHSAEAKENVAVNEKSGDVSSDGAQSLVAGKSLAKKEAAAKDPGNAAMQLEFDNNKCKHGNEGIVERSSLQSGKKGRTSTVEVGKSSVQKTIKSKKRSGAKATDTVMKDIGDNSAKEKENIAVDNKSRKVGSGGDQSPVSGKPLAKKKVAKSAKTGTKADKESKQLRVNPLASRKVLQDQEHEPKFFIVSGPRSQRNEYQQIIKRLKGKCCRDSHQWSYQATHFIAPEIRRTEKFFAAAASGSWILKTDYVADSKEAGKLLQEEPYEWHSTGLSADGAINLESPRKWRLVREQTGHGALYGLRIVVYGDCTIPSLDTLKRAVKAGDGTILATAPPYTRFLNQNTDFALISPGMPRDDVWIQEFIRHEIPCVLSDYLVEYVCKPGYALDKHVLYNTNSWAERSFNKMQLSADVCTI
ncbi:BRCT domain [Arabidopsis thaliana x Arabidopsis arenosa]|uniref:BRCT domain n=1 Tax=Arabidopsis thaliana x Arabidopsis arenosa TaxID=1240361 RepID=A0A8T1Z3B4_9BRAS|nr:BRCT domain [Arabidopsis thaliana x Arabidopsis arenosa]